MPININETIREAILDLTEREGYRALTPEELLTQVKIELVDWDGAERIAHDFVDTMNGMCDIRELSVSRNGKIVSGRSMGYLRGTFRANAKGFGFLTPDERYTAQYDEDLFIGADNTGAAMNGDLVTVRVIPRSNTRSSRFSDRERSMEAEVVCIVERALTHVIGTLQSEEPITKKAPVRYHVVPDNAKITARIIIPQKDLGDARVGDKVEAEITRYPSVERPDALGHITYIFGETMSKEANYEVILHENHIRTEFPEDVLAEAEAQEQRPILPDGRLDLRDKMIFTIDGAESKDLDDAVSLEVTEDGYLLGVHIADVSDYVRENTALDAEAFARGTSVYFVDKVVPMLPNALSNGICSLNAGEDRFALSALISLDKEGNIRGCTLHESVIHSKIRGVYAELNDILDKGEASPHYEKYAALFPHIYPEMVRLYEILDKKNKAKGALELETAEAKFILDENGFPVDIVKRERGISECLIEQFMLCANEAVALWLYERKMPCVYRVHEEPPAEKLQTFSEFAYNLGLDIRPLRGKEVRPVHMQAIMTEAKEKGLDTVLSTVMLRSLSKAKYARTQGEHFGLATEYYCHFTSPIRRYPDLTVHRFVKNILNGRTDEKTVRHMEGFAEKSAVQSTECEIRALNAERSIEDLYKVLYMQSQVGAVFDGTISSVTSFGFYVELDNTCEGLVPIVSLDGFFVFDEKNLVLSCGERKYRIGQKVRVTLTSANLILRKLDMELSEDDPSMQGHVRHGGDGRNNRFERTDRTDRTDRNSRGGRYDSGRTGNGGNHHAEARSSGHRGGKVR